MEYVWRVSERGGDGHILRGDIIQFWLLLFSCKVSQGWRMACSHVARRLAMCHGNNSPAFMKKKARVGVKTQTY